jgi:transcriptional repressor NrdR
VAPGVLEKLVSDIERVAAERVEISSNEIGRLVLTRLQAIDQAAYLRFASVHKGFTGPRDFEREMAALDEDR